MSVLYRRVSERWTLLLFLMVYAGLSLYCWWIFLRYPTVENYPLFSVEDLFRDLLSYNVKMTHLNRGAGPVGAGYPVFNYLAPAAFVYSFFFRTRDPVGAFLLLVGMAFAIVIAGSGWLLARRGLLRPLHVLVLLLLLGSYPMMILLARANLEGVVWILATGFLLLFLRGQYLWSAVLLGLAMSIKPFPGLYVLLFLPIRQFRAAGVALGVAAASVLLAMHELGPTIVQAYRGLQPGIALYTNTYVVVFRVWWEQRYSHGILDALKIMKTQSLVADHRSIFDLVGKPVPPELWREYLAMTVLLCGAMLWRLPKLPMLNQIFGCAIALTILPPLCADYTLCTLYVPLFLLGYFVATEVQAGRQRWTVAHLALLALPLGALMAPMQCFGLFMSPVRCGLLLVLLVGVLLLPLELRELRGEGSLA